MSSVRARTIARWKALAAAGAVASGCHGAGYGVVDPMPMPSCFDSPHPTATVSFVTRAGAESEPAGTRFVEVVVSYTQTNVTVGKVSAVDNATGNELNVVDRTSTANGFRAIVRLPKGITEVLVSAPTQCPGHGNPLIVVFKVEGDSVTVSQTQ